MSFILWFICIAIESVDGVSINDFRLGIQLCDKKAGAYTGSPRYTPFFYDSTGWAQYPWAGDSNYDNPDGIRIGLFGRYNAALQSSEFKIENTDIRFCVQLTDHATNKHGNDRYNGEETCTPWSSSGGGWSEFAHDSNCYNFDAARVKIETQPFAGLVISDIRIGIRLTDSCVSDGKRGAPQFSDWLIGSGSKRAWSAWAGDSNFYDPDAVQIYAGFQKRFTNPGDAVTDYNYPFSATSGGRGGTEYWVTSVDDDVDDPNTLRGAIMAAIDSGKPAYIRFKIACTAPIIELRDSLEMKWIRQLTIDGSDQPGGVTIAHYETKLPAATHLILRHLRFRPGREGIDRENDEKDKCNAKSNGREKNCGTGNDALTIVTGNMILVEHCSFNLATDEALSVKGSRRVILRHNIISSGITAGGYTHFERHGYNAEVTKGYHNFGSLWYGNDDLVAHNNLWSGLKRRCPQILSSSYCCEDGKEDKSASPTELIDTGDDCPSDMDFCWNQRPSPRLYVFNNVIACEAGTTLKGYRGTINLWKNVYLNGNPSDLKNSIRLSDGDCKWIKSADNAFEGRLGDVDDKKTADYPEEHPNGNDCGSNPDTKSMNDVSPEQLLQDMMAGYVPGAWPHDGVDEEVMQRLEANNYDVPEQDGYYDDAANSKACIKGSTSDRFSIIEDAAQATSTSTSTWIAVAVCVVVVVAAVALCGGYHSLYRKVNDDEDVHAMVTTEDATGKVRYDMAPLATNETGVDNGEHEEDAEDAEIEVDVEIDVEMLVQ